MPSFAVLSDIHGNFDAVDVIWRELLRLNLTGRPVLNAGDSVAYGPDSNSCIEFIKSHKQIVSVGGNYDNNVAEYPARKAEFERKWKSKRPEKLMAIRQASEQISDEQRQWLADLPKSLDFVLEGKRIYLGHYSPLGSKVGIGSWTSDDQLLDIARAVSYDVIVSGHTHTPFVRRAGGVVFINPGSVGRSWFQPTYAVLTIENGQISGEVMR